MVKFVLLTTQRSGSYYIVKWLNSHPNIWCHAEIFKLRSTSFSSYRRKNFFFKVLWDCLGKPPFSRYRWNLPLAFITQGFLKQIFNRRILPWVRDPNANTASKVDIEKVQCVGFKLTYGQLERNCFLEPTICSEGWRILHLVRRNILKVYLSELVRTKRAGLAHSTHLLEVVKVTVDTKTLLDKLSNLKRNQIKWRGRYSKNTFLEIYYEDFFKNRSNTQSEIARFLGCQNEGWVNPPLVKTSPENISDYVENYEEVKQVLKGTHFEPFLYDR